MKKAILVSILVSFLAVSTAPNVFASSEVVDSDVVSTDETRLCLALYKDLGEQDPNWDYYALRVTVEDIKYRNDWWIGPLGLRLYLYVNGEEVPANHQPTAGWRWGQSHVSFSYKGIGFQLLLPAYNIGYSVIDYSGNLKRYEWTVTGVWCGLAYWFIYEDYAEFAVGVRVPQGQRIYAYAGVAVSYYKFYILWFSKVSDDICYWAYVSHSPSASSLSAEGLVSLGSSLTPPAPIDLKEEIPKYRSGGGGKWDIYFLPY